MASTPIFSGRQWIRQRVLQKLDEISKPVRVNILLATFNVNNKVPSKLEDLNVWLFQCQAIQPDLVIVGLQEMELMTDNYQNLPYSETKEYGWRTILGKVLTGFELVVIRKLIGTSIFLFAKKELKEKVKQVSSCAIPSGLMGVIGNKGAVAIRFRLFSHKYIVVSSHLAAHEQYYSRRNYDYAEISRRLLFPLENSQNLLLEDEIFEEIAPANIEDCDFCFWMGDLNYRVELDSFEARRLLAQNKFDELIKSDQLYRSIKLGDAFEGFEEGPILFPPTFKYNIGTSEFDSSEKFRTPSWTDRILWKNNGRIELMAYWNALDVTISDHKPVAAIFVVNSLRIDLTLLGEVYKQVLKEIDSIENAAIPSTILEPGQLDIGQIHFGISKDFELILTNESDVIANWGFIGKSREAGVSKSWINPHPLKGALMPSKRNHVLLIIFSSVGAQAKLKLTIEVTGREAYRFNKELEPVQDILVLHVENGRDHFLLVEGNFRKSVFGVPLEELDLIDGMPAPLKHLIDVLQIYTPSNLLFFELGDPKLCDKIVEMLDRKEKLAFDLSYSPECISITIAQVILMFFDALPDPLVPSDQYSQFIKASYDRNVCFELVNQLPALNRYIFETFVLNYLKRHCVSCGLEGRNLSYLCRIISSVLIKAKDSAKLAKEEELRDLRHKARFIKQFLALSPTSTAQEY